MFITAHEINIYITCTATCGDGGDVLVKRSVQTYDVEKSKNNYATGWITETVAQKLTSDSDILLFCGEPWIFHSGCE